MGQLKAVSYRFLSRYKHRFRETERSGYNYRQGKQESPVDSLRKGDGFDLARYFDPRRFREVARLHSNAFRWRPQGRIPLGIHVNDPAYTAGLSYREWLNPEPFFDSMIRLDQAGADFDLALVGEQFRTAPAVFAESWPSLQPHIVHTGFIADRSEYLALLRRCDIVVSTAIQENFGIAVAEAILAGCQPLLPNRLAYPELIPEEFHASCLYSSGAMLFDRLQYLIDGTGRLSSTRLNKLREATESRFGAQHMVQRIDDELRAVVQRAHC
jgi:hypothetical protein